MDNGWEKSAAAWIAGQGESGDWTRRHVLDPGMLSRIPHGHFVRALDVGCGEGRFCRILRGRGIEAVGIDPTVSLIDHARRRDPNGNYVIAGAEAIPFEAASFDLVVAYLSLIDIPHLAGAISEMERVLMPGGALLIGNLASFATSSVGSSGGWLKDKRGERSLFAIDRYLEERSSIVEWANISIRNWHRPLSTYFRLLLGAGLQLAHFDEPKAVGCSQEEAANYERVPYCLVMEWRKPAASG